MFGAQLALANSPPIVDNLHESFANVGEEFYYKVNATDPDNDSLLFFDNCEKFEINRTTGEIFWIPNKDDAGLLKVNITISDGVYNVTQKLLLHINNKVCLTDIPEIVLMEDSVNNSVDLRDYTIDEDNDTLIWDVIGGKNINATIEDSKLIIVPDKDFYGKENITIVAKDNYSSSRKNTTIIVLPVNDPPIANKIPTVRIEEGMNAEINLSEFFSDVDSELNFSIRKEPKNVYAEINGSIAILTADEDFIGVDRIIFSASDGEHSIDSNEVKISVLPRICEEGKIGLLDIDVREPHSYETFEIGEKIEIEVRVWNNNNFDIDARVEAILYDIDDYRIVDIEKSEIKNIGEGERKTFRIELNLPYGKNLEEDNDFYLYVKAYENEGEDWQCTYEEIPIDLEKEKHDVEIMTFSITPKEVECGDKINLVTKVKNTGTEEENVYITIKSPLLKISELSRPFYLDENDWKTEIFEVEIPQNIDEGEYWIYCGVFYNNGNDFNEDVEKIFVKCEKEKETTKTENKNEKESDLILRLLEENISVKIGRPFYLPIEIVNNGNERVVPVINLSGYEMWANVIGIEKPEFIEENSKGYAYLYLNTKDGVPSGMHTLIISLGHNGKKNESVIVTNVNLISGEVTKKTKIKSANLDGKILDILDKDGFWIFVDIFLVLVALWLIKKIFKR